MWHFTVYFTTLLKLISSYFSRKQNNEDDFLDDGKFTLYKNVYSDYNWKLSIHKHVVSEFAFFLIRLFVLLFFFFTKYLFSVCNYYCWKNPENFVSADDCCGMPYIIILLIMNFKPKNQRMVWFFIPSKI